MTLTIKINMDNAAFDPCPGAELARILRPFVEGIEDETEPQGMARTFYDSNGNRVGDARVTGR